MSIVNRILEILEKSGLTPSEFADKIGVQRSAISHITSGRNKPSLEFLVKIKKEFPEIDAEWLVFGLEKVEKEIVETTSVTNPAPTLFDLENELETQHKDSNLNEENPPDLKKIKKILLIYEDGTFEEFSPK
ncbi:MAG: helix-turn-helix transcriptional regulator [Moheibacter sp.]